MGSFALSCCSILINSRTHIPVSLYMHYVRAAANCLWVVGVLD